MHNLNPLKIDEINLRSNLKTNNYCMKLGMLAFDAELTSNANMQLWHYLVPTC